jgi:RNA polymerase sigma-70 factor (ECF subfamily)
MAAPLTLVPTERRAPLDGALLSSFLEGCESAFCELVQRHERVVLQVVRRYARSPEEARDLAQRTFLRAFEASRRVLGATRFAEGSDAFPFRPWLLRIALNLGKNHHRQLRRWAPAPLTVIDCRAAQTPTALEQLLEEEKRRRVQAELLLLPRRQREVLGLRIDAGMSFADIALTLGITENNAKVHFHHAVKRLRCSLCREEV